MLIFFKCGNKTLNPQAATTTIFLFHLTDSIIVQNNKERTATSVTLSQSKKKKKNFSAMA